MDEQAQQDLLPVVAVVDAVGATAVIWWVDVAASPGLSRMCGAWVLPPGRASQVALVIGGRHVLATSAGCTLLDDLDLVPASLVDAGATREAVQAQCAALEQAHSEHRAVLAGSGCTLVDPVWPPVPPVLHALPAAASRQEGEVVVAALALARWVVSLCAAWSEMEGQRLRRTHLRPLGGTATRDLPVVTRPRALDGRPR